MDQSPYYASQQGGFMSNTPSASQSPGGSTRKAVQYSLRPLTVAQALNAEQLHADAEFLVDKVEVGQLTIVAHVVSIQPQATNSVYWLDDGSGRIEARHWVDSSEDPEEVEPGLGVGCYVRVMGTLKNFHNKRYINATQIRAVKDYSEVLHHLMNAAFVQQCHAVGAPAQPGANGHATGVNGNGMSAYMGGPTAAGSQHDQYMHLSPLQRSIVQFILNQPPSDIGVHVSAIARSVGTDANKISEALDSLMDEGHVFSTIDESHFNVSN